MDSSVLVTLPRSTCLKSGPDSRALFRAAPVLSFPLPGKKTGPYSVHHVGDPLRVRKSAGMARSPLSCGCHKPPGNGSPPPEPGAGGGGDAPLDRAKEGDAKDTSSGSHPLSRFPPHTVPHIGFPVHTIMSDAGKRVQEYLSSYRNRGAKEVTPDDCNLEWNWDDWMKHISEVQEHTSVASALKFQLDDAVGNEDFEEAARLKGAIDAATANDFVTKAMDELKKALEEECYEEAAKIRDELGAGLVGWWVGLSQGEDDPFGRIIHISPEQGRYMARSYTARQLLTAAPGIRIFEIFLRKDGESYQQQAVYLQREGILVGSPSSTGSLERGGKAVTTTQVTEVSVHDGGNGDVEESLGDEGLSQILSFLKDRIPDLKMKVFRVISPNADEDISKIVERLVEETVVPKEDENGVENLSTENKSDQQQQESFIARESRDSSEKEENDDTPKLGGSRKSVIQSITDSKEFKVPVRVPAKIEYKSHDSFVFHIDDVGMQQPSALLKESAPPVKIAAVLSQASADLLGPDAAKTLSDVKKVSVKVSKELGEFLKLAVSQVQKRRGLSKSTHFQRLKISESNTDALCGLYVGSFGPFTSELVQLRRKHGNWHESIDASSDSGNLEFFEYVEAMKLTGDLNVPAGQVTFRARTGKEFRIPHRGVYPEELGVIARYKGQGRLAEPGFKNPQWIDGELLLLDGKGAGQLNGAELGFVYSVPERHFLVLFHRLKLQN